MGREFRLGDANTRFASLSAATDDSRHSSAASVRYPCPRNEPVVTGNDRSEKLIPSAVLVGDLHLTAGVGPCLEDRGDSTAGFCSRRNAEGRDDRCGLHKLGRVSRIDPDAPRQRRCIADIDARRI